MLIPPENTPDLMALRGLLFAVMSLPLVVAMAGGYPCCCTEGDGSTSTTRPPSSTSTSTSTGDGPPLPPRPGSTSTATPPVDPPRRRSSSVGPVSTTSCDCCAGGAVADQWQIEVTGVANDGICSPGTEMANGVYIADDVATGETSVWHSTCTTVQLNGCGTGGVDIPNEFCPEERLFYEWQFFVAAVRGVVANTSVDYLTYFHVTWRGIPPATCGGNHVNFQTVHVPIPLAAKPAFSPVQCASLTDPTILIVCNDLSGTTLPGVSAEGGTATIFIVDGF